MVWEHTAQPGDMIMSGPLHGASHLPTGLDPIPDDGRLQRVVLKTTQTVNNSTTLVAVPELQFKVDGNSVYQFRFDLLYTSGATPDIKFDFAGPSGYNGYGWWIAQLGGATGVYGYGLGGAINFDGNGAELSAIFQGTLRTVNSGYYSFRFAQNTLNASNTTLNAGSSCFAVKVK